MRIRVGLAVGATAFRDPILRAPVWTAPGEAGIVLNASTGRLEFFRSIPTNDQSKGEQAVVPDWNDWFPAIRTEMYLPKPGQDPRELKVPECTQILEPLTDRQSRPPDAYDTTAVWRGVDPDSGKTLFVQAAAYRGNPTYFQVFTESEFEGSRAVELSPTSRSGLNVGAVIYFVCFGCGLFFALRNYRSGRGDRRGSRRLAGYLFVVNLLSFTALTDHSFDLFQEMKIVDLVIAGSMFSTGLTWLWYLAVEQVLRRWWPEVLVTLSRLLQGRIVDPLVGRDLLIGSLFGMGSGRPDRMA